MKNTVLILAFLVLLAACGADNGTKVTEPADVSSSSKTVKSSSSSKAVIQSGGSHEESSSGSSKAVIQSSSSRHSGLDSESSSSKKDGGSSSAMTSSSKAVSSSSVILSGSEGSSDSSSSSKKVSSSSEYVPFNHYKCLADNWNYEKSDYKTFVDPRNGRSYYYYTATSDFTGKSITVMAENLNIGDMVLGENNQNDDSKIERYCYNNDTTYCDHYGGLYQWAEMMQLPSRCNTESCSELIQENHRGICPEGWRLFTYDDYIVVAGFNDDRMGESIVEGLRSQCFSGYNTSGFSLIGGGLRTAEGKFSDLNNYATWFRPEEYEQDATIRAHHAIVASQLNSGPQKEHRELKIKGFSVRCTKLE